MSLAEKAKENLAFYTAAIVLLTVLVCWYLWKYNGAEKIEHALNSGVLGRTVGAVTTATLMDRIHGPDGMTVVDKEFEQIMQAQQGL